MRKSVIAKNPSANDGGEKTSPEGNLSRRKLSHVTKGKAIGTILTNAERKAGRKKGSFANHSKAAWGTGGKPSSGYGKRGGRKGTKGKSKNSTCSRKGRLGGLLTGMEN